MCDFDTIVNRNVYFLSDFVTVVQGLARLYQGLGVRKPLLWAAFAAGLFAGLNQETRTLR